ncbi:hypothetical protein D3C78_1855900 [compost metagenome]
MGSVPLGRAAAIAPACTSGFSGEFNCSGWKSEPSVVSAEALTVPSAANAVKEATARSWNEVRMVCSPEGRLSPVRCRRADRAQQDLQPL